MATAATIPVTYNPQSLANLQYASGALQGSTSPVQASPLTVQGNNTAVQGSTLNPNDYTVANTTTQPVPVDPYAAYGGYSAYSNNLGQYDQGISTLEQALARAGSQLGIAQGNINTQFGVNQNELNSAKNQATQSYQQSGTQNGQNLQTNKNTIADQASQGLRGLLRTLGAYGAGGSSDALYVAPQTVAQQATSQRNGANQTFAQNQQGLDTNYNNFLTQDAGSRQKLQDWQTQQLNSAQSQSDTAKQNLLSQLAQLNGQKAAYQGGSYTGAAQPYLDQANGLSSTIDQLAAINPTYNGTTPTYTAPPLASYVNNGNTATTTGQGALQDTTTPYLTALLGAQKLKNGIGA